MNKHLKTAIELVAELAVVYYVSGKLAPEAGLSWDWFWQLTVFIVLLMIHDAYIRYDMIRTFNKKVEEQVTEAIDEAEVVKQVKEVLATIKKDVEKSDAPSQKVFEDAKASILISVEKKTDDKPQ